MKRSLLLTLNTTDIFKQNGYAQSTGHSPRDDVNGNIPLWSVGILDCFQSKLNSMLDDLQGLIWIEST